MAINPDMAFPGKTAGTSPEYPYGKARDVSAPGDGTGTPLRAAWVNDWFGLQQQLLSLAGIVPSGVADAVGACQVWEALSELLMTRSDLAGVSGATLLGIGGGRTQADKNAEWVSVTDAPYLVKFDNGTTDNTAGLNAAFQSGKCVFVPDPGAGNFAEVSDTVKIGDNTTIYFQNPSRPAIKASASMNPNKHLVCTKNYAEGVMTPNTGIHIFGINLDANGAARSGGPLTSGVGFVFNAKDSSVDLPTVANSPLWNYFFTSGNPFADVGHDGENAAYSDRLNVTRVTSIDPIGGDGGVVQGTKNSNFIGYRNIINPALAPSKERKDSGLQVVEGCHNLTIDELEFFHNGALSSGFVVSSHVNKQYLSNIKVGTIYGKELSTLVGVFNDTAVQPIGGNDWLTRGLEIGSAHLDYPVLDAASTVMQSRLVDIQNMVDVKVGKCSARIKKDNGSYSAPTCVVNFDGAINTYVDMIVVDGVPDVGSTSYPVSKSRGWVNLSNSSNENVNVGPVSIENFGYLNRIISDTSNGELKSVSLVEAKGVFTDGGTKELIVSSSQDLTVGRCVTPLGSTLGRFGSNFTTVAGENVKVRQAAPDVVLGGQRIKSLNVGGVQSSPGTMYERQFVSASDPTGTMGKGSISFITTAALEGRLSISAYHEDVNEYRPIALFQSTDTVKAFAPVIDDVMSVGVPSARCSIGYFAQGVQTTSDARLKSEVRAMTQKELSAASVIAKEIGFFRWLADGSDRLHCGTTVQAVIKCMNDAGLNAFDYGFVCHDEWGDEFMDVMEVVEDCEGNITELPTGERVLVKPAGDIYSLRDHELYKFLARAQESRIADVEARLSAAGL